MIPPRRRKSFSLPLELASIGLKGRYSFPSPMKFLGTSSGGKDGPYVIGAMFSAAYSEKAKRLAASCERFALPYVIHEVPTVHRSISLRGSDDLAYTKPNFIRHLLATHRKPVLYLDADCEFVSEPDLIKDLIGSRCDFSIHNGCAEECTDMYVPLPLRLQSDGPVIRNRFYRYGGSFSPYSRTQLICSGLVQLWANTIAAHALLRRWHRAIAAFPGAADDACLNFVFNNLTTRSWLPWLLRVAWLPNSYARISWWIYVKPVINHPDRPSPSRGFKEIRDPRGRRKWYVSQMEERREGIFPRDCIIDTKQNLLCRFVDGKLVQVGPTGQSLWILPGDE
jgi:hypothetical protein